MSQRLDDPANACVLPGGGAGHLGHLGHQRGHLPEAACHIVDHHAHRLHDCPGPRFAHQAR